MTNAFVLHSGGMDSTTCLYLALRDHNSVIGVSIDYGQRHRKEIQHAIAICDALDVPSVTLDGPKNLDSMLTDESQEIPSKSYDELPKGVSPTYVPFRNGQFLSIIAAFASMQTEEAHIYFGAHAEDAQNWAYPDCTPEFVGAMANAIYIGTYHKVRLIAPLVHLMKHEIITIGEKLGVPWEMTWSCLAKGTEVLTLAGKERIEDIKPGRWVWGFDEVEKRWIPSLVESSWFQGIKEVYEVELHDGAGHYKKFKATGDHLLMLREGGYIRVDEVHYGVRLMPANPHKVVVGKNKTEYYTIRPHNIWDEQRVYMHRYVADFFGIKNHGVIHHGDKGSLNNDPSNLSSMTLGEHTKLHIKKAHDKIWNDEVNARRSAKVLAQWANMSDEEREARRRAIKKGRSEQNHVVQSIRKVGEEPTYDLQTYTENFAISAGIIVHNCYKGGDKQCGECPTCRARKDAFQKAGVNDQTVYAI